MRKFFKRIIFTAIFFMAGLYIWGRCYYFLQPPLVARPIVADTARIRTDLYYLTKECRFRNFLHNRELKKSAAYIRQQFLKVSSAVSWQPYIINDPDSGDVEYGNVICSFGPANAERIIIGAHYDVCMNKEGADDNASGVCGILEMARLLQNERLQNRVDIVTYTNEEPPFFDSKDMGSYIHAQSLFKAGIKVKGMICLEMIGTFYEEPNTQDYPLFFLNWFYGDKGNFITVVQKFGNGDFGSLVREKMKTDQVVPTRSFTAPQWLSSINLSDHRNYWQFGYSAVMITNTAFYRNKNYHQNGDVAEKLNIPKMAKVIDEVYRTVKAIANHTAE